MDDGGGGTVRGRASFAFTEAVERLAASRTVDDVIAVLRERARALIGADGVCIALREGDECHYVAEDAIGPLFAGQRYPLTECISGRAMLGALTVVSPDVLSDRSLPRAAYAATFARSVVMAPVGRPPVAAIGAYWQRKGTPAPEAVAAAESLARAAEIALDNVRLIASLAQSERRMRDVLDSVSDVYYALDRDWRLVSFNAAAERYFGLSRQDVIGRVVWELFPQGQGSPYETVCRLAMEHGRSGQMESPSALRPGRFVELRVGPTGEGVYVALTDITERRAAEADLRASEARLRERADELEAVLDAAPSAIWIARDNAATQIDGNRAARELLRVDRAQNMSKSGAGETLTHFRVLDASGAEIAPDDLPVQCAARGETVTAFEERIVFDDGVEAHLLGNAAPLRDDTGAPRGAVAAFADITGLKKIERDLREREMMFRSLAESIGDVFYIMERNPRRLLYVSPAFGAIWGRDPAWLIADVKRYDQTVHPDDRDRVRTAYAAWDQAGPLEMEHRIVREDGAVRWVLSRTFPAADDSGRIVGLAEDVTERKREARRRDLMLHELNHRVKNTLTVVQAMALQATATPDRARGALTFDARLQALARAHDALTQNAWESGDLPAIVRRAVVSHEDRADRFEIDGPAIMVNARTALALTLALHELGTNAIKYGALSAPDGRVRIAWAARDGRLRLSWRETGGPAVSATHRRGFGMRLIERGLAHELNGTVQLAFEPDGVVCTVDAPLPDASNDMIGSPSGRAVEGDGT